MYTERSGTLCTRCGDSEKKKNIRVVNICGGLIFSSKFRITCLKIEHTFIRFSDQDYRKLTQKITKKRTSLVKKQEKIIKGLKEKLSKGKCSKESVQEVETQHEKELIAVDREDSTKVS